MRTPAQRGRYGRWLVTAREDKGYDTAVKALDALAAAGVKIGKSTYAEYEAGTKVPSRNHLPLLEGFWGPVPDDDEGPDQSAILAAIDRQTAMLERVLTAITGQMIPPDRLMALETWMDWMAANPSQPQRSPRRPAKQRSAPTL